MTFSLEFMMLCDLSVSDYVMDSSASGFSSSRFVILSLFFYLLTQFEVFFFLFVGEVFWVNISIILVNLIQSLQLSNAEISKLSVKDLRVNISGFVGQMVSIATT